jgi:hypothetical protein
LDCSPKQSDSSASIRVLGAITLSGGAFQRTSCLASAAPKLQLAAAIPNLDFPLFARRYYEDPRWFLFLRLVICLSSAGRPGRVSVGFPLPSLHSERSSTVHRVQQPPPPMPLRALVRSKIRDSRLLVTRLPACCRVLPRPRSPEIRCWELFYRAWNDPSAGSPTETLLRLVFPLDGQVQRLSLRPCASLTRPIGNSDGRCVQRAGT